MPPLIPRRRRSRRRSWSGRVVLLVCALIALTLVIGGFARVSSQSGPYDSSLNRSFAAAGGAVGAESGVTGSDLRHLMTVMPTENRRTVQAQLDGIVQQSGRQSVQATTLAGGGDAEGRAQFAAAFSDRATAAQQVRAAFDGLLGMHPLPIAGTSGSAGTEAASPTLLTSEEASNRLESAGELLTRSDQSLTAVRHALAHAAGHARLSTSNWITDASAWQSTAVLTVVDAVGSSPQLAATHDLVLRTVQISPQALPPATGVASPGVSTISPTKKLGVSVVISNLGSVDEPHASVQFTLTSLSASLTSNVTRSVALASGTSVALSQVYFAVKSGQSYRINVAIVLPAAQSDLTNTSETEILNIAPGT